MENTLSEFYNIFAQRFGVLSSVLRIFPFSNVCEALVELQLAYSPVYQVKIHIDHTYIFWPCWQFSRPLEGVVDFFNEYYFLYRNEKLGAYRKYVV